MDPATLIGVGAGLVVIVVANVMEGGNPMSLLLLPPMLLVFGTTHPGRPWPAARSPDAKHAIASLKTRVHRQGASGRATSSRPSSALAEQGPP